MSPVFLKANHLVKRFGSVVAANDVSFEVNKGEVLTLLGPSGCGKTTTLRLIAGFEKPDRGELVAEGKYLVSVAKRILVPPEKREMGMVFQSYALWPHMNVFENVAYPLRLRGIKGQEARKKVAQVLELVGLSQLEERSAMLLSGGQQQRVALARALVYSPKILLLDEPLSNLDAKLREQMRVDLTRLQRQLSITVIFVTHDQVEAMTLSDRLAVMNDGRIEQIGSPREIYEHPLTPFVQEFIGRVIWFEGEILEAEGKGVVVSLSGNGTPSIRCAQAHGTLQRGERAVLAIRPEEIDVQLEDEGKGWNRIPCVVESAIFLGDHFECHLKHRDLRFNLSTARSQPLSPGQRVSVRVAPEAVHAWRKA